MRASEGDQVKYRDVVKIIEADGWCYIRTQGSHMIYRHATKPGTVTIPGGGKLNNDIRPGTLASVLKQAGLNRENL